MCILACALTSMGPTAMQAGAVDVVEPAPQHERVHSPSGRFALQIELRPMPNAFAARSTATLFAVDKGRQRVLWRRELPHRPRPRFALVGDDGGVVLLDEWLRVRSELAVMVIDAGNRVLAQYDLEAVRAALDVPIALLARRARHGVWMQGVPAITPDGRAVQVHAADRLLVIRLADGALQAR